MAKSLTRDRTILRLIAFVTALFIACLLPCPIGAQTVEEKIEGSFRGGQVALQQGKFTDAVEDFKRVLQLDPALVQAQVDLGLAYQSLLDYGEAVRWLTKALRDKPALLGPNVIVGMDYLRLGHPDKAIPYLQAALKLDPSNRDARQALAFSYVALENIGSAAAQFRRMADADSDKPGAWFKLGHEYLDLAARLAYRGARLYPDSPWGHRFLGDLYYERTRWQDAVVEYQRALASDADERGLHAAMGRAYLQALQFDRAEAEFRSELQVDPSSEQAYLGLANLDFARNQPAAAIENLKRVQQISPEFLAVQRELPPTWQKEPQSAAPSDDAGQNPCKAHHYSRCIASLESQKRLTDSEWLSLGKARLSLRRYDSAADALAQVHAKAAENAEASYWLERTFQALGADSYAQIEEQFPNSWRAHQLRAESCALRKKFQDALEEFQAALALNANEPQLHEDVGELYMETNHFDAAQHELEQTLTEDPSRAHALYLLGRLYVLQGDNEKAMPYLARALRIEPDLSEANRLLGTAYLRRGRFANAIPFLEKAASTDTSGNIHFELFTAYRNLGQLDRAKKELALSQDARQSRFERDQALVLGSSSP